MIKLLNKLLKTKPKPTYALPSFFIGKEMYDWSSGMQKVQENAKLIEDLKSKGVIEFNYNNRQWELSQSIQTTKSL